MLVRIFPEMKTLLLADPEINLFPTESEPLINSVLIFCFAIPQFKILNDLVGSTNFTLTFSVIVFPCPRVSPALPIPSLTTLFFRFLISPIKQFLQIFNFLAHFLMYC